jgi:hypothetical protein
MHNLTSRSLKRNQNLLSRSKTVGGVHKRNPERINLRIDRYFNTPSDIKIFNFHKSGGKTVDLILQCESHYSDVLQSLQSYNVCHYSDVLQSLQPYNVYHYSDVLQSLQLYNVCHYSDVLQSLQPYNVRHY